MRYRSLLKVFASLYFILLLTNCTKIKTTDIGLELIPLVDNVTTFDTSLEVIGNSYIIPDSLLPRLGRNASADQGIFLLGHISDDPLFGKTTASIFIQLKPEFYPFRFENVTDSLYLDSAVLGLKWVRTYGDTNAVQKVSVHRLITDLKSDSAYKTNVSAVYGEELGSATFIPSTLNDSIALREKKLTSQLRIKMNNSFAQTLLVDDTSSTGRYKSDSLFNLFLKGFAIVPDVTGQGANANALISFAMADSATNLRLYYRYKKNGLFDTTFLDFTATTTKVGPSANQILRDPTGSQASQFNGTNLNGDSLIYIQAEPGRYAMLKIPGIEEFKSRKGNVMVHLAQLSMEEVVTPGRKPEIFPAPQYMYAEIYDSSSNKYFPFSLDGLNNGQFDPNRFNSQRKTVTDNENRLVSRYNLNLTRYFQNIVTRNSANYPIRLSAPYFVAYSHIFTFFSLNPIGAGHVVLGGGNYSNPTKKMKLRIVYSKL